MSSEFDLDETPSTDYDDLKAPPIEMPEDEQNEEENDEEGEEEIEKPQPTLAEKRVCRKLAGNIRNYLSSSFREVLGDIAELNLNDMCEEELREVLEECKMLVGSRNSQLFSQQAFKMGINVFEQAGVSIGYNIGGLANIMTANPQTNLLIEEMALEYQDLFYTKPIYKFGFLMFATAAQLHNSREVSNTVKSEMEKPVPTNIANKYKDL